MKYEELEKLEKKHMKSNLFIWSIGMVVALAIAMLITIGLHAIGCNPMLLLFGIPIYSVLLSGIVGLFFI